MSENYTKVQQAFRVLHPLLAGYICQEMSREYQDNWWQEVLMTLSDQVRDLPNDNGDYATLMDSLDMANCLRLFDRKWNDLFKRKLSIDYRTWAKELMGVRNKLAHIGGTDFSEDDTWRALDTMARLCEAFDDEAAEEIRKILRQLNHCFVPGVLYGLLQAGVWRRSNIGYRQYRFDLDGFWQNRLAGIYRVAAVRRLIMRKLA